jgi:hypothetical protein
MSAAPAHLLAITHAGLTPSLPRNFWKWSKRLATRFLGDSWLQRARESSGAQAMLQMGNEAVFANATHRKGLRRRVTPYPFQHYFVTSALRKSGGTLRVKLA